MPLLKSLAGKALSLVQSETVVHRGVTIPSKRFRFGGKHFQEDEAFLGSGEREAQRLIETFGLSKETHVLEIGTGPGRLPIGILQTVGDIQSYQSFDVSMPAVRWCKRHIQSKHPNFQFTHIDMYNARYNPAGTVKHLKLPIADASIDIIYLYSVFSHLLEEDVRTYLQEFARVLKPGGHVFLTMFLEENVPNVAENPEGYRDTWKGALHCVRFDKKFFQSILDQYGLTMESMEYATETDGQSGVFLRRD